ncbi:MAG: hypothetical protein FJ390_03310 [Verrucomicrobia bacterium]|nr:hypothetical protein [Verrucomicrobiota bacterium]
MGYLDPDVSSNIAYPSITAPSLTGGRKEGPEAEVQDQPSGVFGEVSVTLDGTISKTFKEAYNKSFVSLEKSETLSSVPQQQLLKNAEAVKNVAQQMINDTVEESQATVASDMLAANEVFLQAAEEHYLRYIAAGGFDQEQTDQENPTIGTQLKQNKFNQEAIQDSFTMINNIAMKALIFT